MRVVALTFLSLLALSVPSSAQDVYWIQPQDLSGGNSIDQGGFDPSGMNPTGYLFVNDGNLVDYNVQVSGLVPANFDPRQPIGFPEPTIEVFDSLVIQDGKIEVLPASVSSQRDIAFTLRTQGQDGCWNVLEEDESLSWCVVSLHWFSEPGGSEAGAPTVTGVAYEVYAEWAKLDESFEVVDGGARTVEYVARYEGPITIAQIANPPCTVHDPIGDFDRNGTVEFADFLILSGNFGTEVTAYRDGDANCSGAVDFEDFLLLSGNFGASSAGAISAPEPSGLAAFAIGACLLGACRRRR